MVSSLAELGWEAECYYSGRGERRTITKQGGVGGGCDSKHCWLMELLLDPTTISLGSSTNFFLCQNISAGPRLFFLFFVMRKRNCHVNTGLLRFADGKYRQLTVATIVPLRRFRRFLRKK